MTELQVPAKAEQDEKLQIALNHCRELLGVTKYSSKRAIKNSIYEMFHWSQSKQGHTREQFESAVALLLMYHEPSTSAEAKAARAQEEADKKIRSRFTNKFYLVQRAELLVVDADLASTRRVLRRVYENLTVKERLSFIKVAGKAFDLNRREKNAIAKQDAESKARWDVERTNREATQNTLNAYYKEQNATKKAALWKSYLALTKAERNKKSAAKKVEEKRIADGLANIESAKASDPALWSQAVHAAAKAAAISVLGRYFYSAQLHEGKGTAGSYGGRNSDALERVQQVVISMAGIDAVHTLAVLPNGQYPGYATDLNGYLDEFCVTSGLNVEQVVQELDGYATVLVVSNWDVILQVATYLLAAGSIKNSRTLRKVAGAEFSKPAFRFSSALSTMTMLLPTTPVQPKATTMMLPLAAAAVGTLSKELIH